MMLMIMKDVSFDFGGGMRGADNDGEAKNLVILWGNIENFLHQDIGGHFR
jgi:hypothetical protein